MLVLNLFADLTDITCLQCKRVHFKHVEKTAKDFRLLFVHILMGLANHFFTINHVISSALKYQNPKKKSFYNAWAFAIKRKFL